METQYGNTSSAAATTPQEKADLQNAEAMEVGVLNPKTGQRLSPDEIKRQEEIEVQKNLTTDEIKRQEELEVQKLKAANAKKAEIETAIKEIDKQMKELELKAKLTPSATTNERAQILLEQKRLELQKDKLQEALNQQQYKYIRRLQTAGTVLGTTPENVQGEIVRRAQSIENLTTPQGEAPPVVTGNYNEQRTAFELQPTGASHEENIYHLTNAQTEFKSDLNGLFTLAGGQAGNSIASSDVGLGSLGGGMTYAKSKAENAENLKAVGGTTPYAPENEQPNTSQTQQQTALVEQVQQPTQYQTTQPVRLSVIQKPLRIKRIKLNGIRSAPSVHKVSGHKGRGRPRKRGRPSKRNEAERARRQMVRG